MEARLRKSRIPRLQAPMSCASSLVSASLIQVPTNAPRTFRLLTVDLLELLVGHAPDILPRTLIDQAAFSQSDDLGGVALHQIQVMPAAEYRDLIVLVQAFEVLQDGVRQHM